MVVDLKKLPEWPGNFNMLLLSCKKWRGVCIVLCKQLNFGNKKFGFFIFGLKTD